MQCCISTVQTFYDWLSIPFQTPRAGVWNSTFTSIRSSISLADTESASLFWTSRAAPRLLSMVTSYEHLKLYRWVLKSCLPQPWELHTLSQGRKTKSEEKPVRSICIIWQKVQLDKQQLFWAVCSEEMNHIYGLINCVLHKERGNQRAQAEL